MPVRPVGPIAGWLTPVHILESAGVAQLAEQRFRKPQVARSIRVAGSILSSAHHISVRVSGVSGCPNYPGLSPQEADPPPEVEQTP
jgi:hypothetical protein